MDAFSPQTTNAALLQMVSKLFDHWQLAEEDRLALLGNIDADEIDQLERVVHLLQIHKRLRQLFPQNLDLAYQWMTQPNKAFGGETPVRFAQTADISALASVRSYLSHAMGQEDGGWFDTSRAHHNGLGLGALENLRLLTKKIVNGNDEVKPLDFDLDKWLVISITQPVLALGGRKSIDILGTLEGDYAIVTLLSAMQSGVYHWTACMPMGAVSKKDGFNLSHPAITRVSKKLAEA